MEQLKQSQIFLKKEHPEEQNNLKTILFFGFLQMLYYSSVNGGASLISDVASDSGYNQLGLFSVLVNNLSAALNAFIAPSIISRIPINRVFCISYFLVVFFLAEGILIAKCKNGVSEEFYCQQYFLYPIVILGSWIYGLGSALATVAMVLYTSALTNAHNKGLYFGIILSMTQFSILTGEILSSFLLKTFSVSNFFLIMSLIAIIAVVLAFFLPLPKEKPQCEAQVDEEIEQLQQFQSLPVQQQVVQILKTIPKTKVVPLLPYMFMAGVVLSCQLGLMPEVVQQSASVTFNIPEDNNNPDDENQLLEYVTYCGIVLGFFQFVGGQLVAVFGDKIDKRNFARFNTQLYLLALIGCCILQQFLKYYFSFTLAAIWGITDCMGQTLNNALISERFGDDVRVFGVYTFMNNLGTTVGMGFALIYESTPYFYFFIILTTQIAANLALTYLNQRDDEIIDKISCSDIVAQNQIIHHYPEMADQIKSILQTSQLPNGQYENQEFGKSKVKASTHEVNKELDKSINS